MGKRGKTYNKEILIELAEKFLPLTTEDWQRLVPMYQAASKEKEERTASDLSRSFQNLGKPKKTTGQPSPDPITKKVSLIRKRMEAKSYAGTYGDLSEPNSDSSDDDDNNTSSFAEPLPAVVAAEESLSPDKPIADSNSSAATTAESGKKRKLDVVEGKKTKNSRNSTRVALGSLLSHLLYHHRWLLLILLTF